MSCLIINLERTFDFGETEDLDYTLVEGDGLGDDIAEVRPFLSPCAELCHDIVSCKDVVRHVSCVCVDVINVAIIIFLDAIRWDDSWEVEALVDLIMGTEKGRAG